MFPSNLEGYFTSVPSWLVMTKTLRTRSFTEYWRLWRERSILFRDPPSPLSFFEHGRFLEFSKVQVVTLIRELCYILKASSKLTLNYFLLALVYLKPMAYSIFEVEITSQVTFIEFKICSLYFWMLVVGGEFPLQVGALSKIKLQKSFWNFLLLILRWEAV